MDWECYKQRCDAPETWSRWMLNETIGLLAGRAALAHSLEEALEGEPLTKPAGHRGGPETDMFELGLEADELDAIVALVEHAKQDGSTTSGGRDLRGFVEAWQDYQRQVRKQAGNPTGK